MSVIKPTVRSNLGGLEMVLAHGNAGATETIDLGAGNVHTATLDANCTLTFTGAVSGLESAFTLVLTQDATGSRTVTWPGSVTWPGASAPTLATAAGSVDEFVFMSEDGGTTWRGHHVTRTILSNPMTSVGDIIQGTTAGAVQRLASPLAGKVLTGAGATTSVAYNYPPGYELDYVETATGVSVTATTEAGADVLVTSNAVTYDGSTIVRIEFYCPYADPVVNGVIMRFWLYQKVGAAAAASIGQLGVFSNDNASGAGHVRWPVYLARRMTPSAASIIYSVRASTASGSATVDAGAGGTATSFPMFIRVTKVSGGA